MPRRNRGTSLERRLHILHHTVSTFYMIISHTTSFTFDFVQYRFPPLMPNHVEMRTDFIGKRVPNWKNMSALRIIEQYSFF